MPYILQSQRKRAKTHPENAGELNYAITRVVKEYMAYNRQNYQAFNDVIGALEGAKIEFYRRVVAPYEMEKIRENGDVY